MMMAVGQFQCEGKIVDCPKKRIEVAIFFVLFMNTAAMKRKHDSLVNGDEGPSKKAKTFCCEEADSHFRCHHCGQIGDDHCGSKCHQCKCYVCEGCLAHFVDDDDADEHFVDDSGTCVECVLAEEHYVRCHSCRMFMNTSNPARVQHRCGMFCTCADKHYCLACYDSVTSCVDCEKLCFQCGECSRTCERCNYCSIVMCSDKCKISFRMGGHDYSVCREFCRTRLVPQIEEDMRSDSEYSGQQLIA